MFSYLFLALLGACVEKPENVVSAPFNLPLPAGNAENPLSKEKALLGRYLFYDRSLSGNGKMSCADCHQQAMAFSDGLRVAIGSTGEKHARNSPSLINVAYMQALTWASPLLTELERQMLVPFFSTEPLEMGSANHEEDILTYLKQQPVYQQLFSPAFPDQREPFSFDNVVKAIASFLRTLVSFDSDFDRYAYGGDDAALTDAQLRGLNLFMSERLECHHCHGGINFSQSSRHALSKSLNRPFHNTGLYNVDGKGAYPAKDRGLFDVTGLVQDMGRFRAPSLRNVEFTAPYMHDGSVSTLAGVVDLYDAGGRSISQGSYVGDGRSNPYKSIFIRPLNLKDSEKKDLVSFLHALSDSTVQTNPAFSNPWLEAGAEL